MRLPGRPNSRSVGATAVVLLLLVFTPGFECGEGLTLGPDGLYRHVEGGFYSLSFTPETITIPAGGSKDVTCTFFTTDPAFTNRDGSPSFEAAGLTFKIDDKDGPQELEVLQVGDKTWVSGTYRATYEIRAGEQTLGIHRVSVQARHLSSDPNDPTP